MTLDQVIDKRIEELAEKKFQERWQKFVDRHTEGRWDVERHAHGGEIVIFEALGHKIEIKGAGPFTVKMRQNDDITDYLLKQAFKNGELKLT